MLSINQRHGNREEKTRYGRSRDLAGSKPSGPYKEPGGVGGVGWWEVWGSPEVPGLTTDVAPSVPHKGKKKEKDTPVLTLVGA